jgi:hypothetical protein
MKKPVWAGLLIALLPALAMAQSSFDGTWKLDLGTLPVSKKPNVWLLQDGMYQCKSCSPPIEVKADGKDQPAARQQYDTISVKVVDDRTISEIEKKNGQTVSDEKFTVSDDGNTTTDEFANWKISMRRLAKGPSGSHALSGSWQTFKVESTSDNDLLVTYKLEGETLSMSRPTGQSYAAKLDGTLAPYKGEPGTNGVSVKRVDANRIEETDELDGKVISVTRLTVAPDGKSMTIVVRSGEPQTTNRFVAVKQ